MKNKISVAVLMLGMAMMLMSTNVTTTNLEPMNKRVEENCIDNKAAEDDDLRCVIRDKDGNKLGACWFCDCAELAKWLT